MAKFLLIMHGDPDDWQSREPSEVDEIIQRFEGWSGCLMGETEQGPGVAR